MASAQTHMDYATSLGYHGTTVGDPLLFRYAELYDNFTQYRFSIPYTSTDKAFIQWMRQNQQNNSTLSTATYLNEIPVYPCQITTHSNTEPVVVSTTSTSTTSVLESSNTSDNAINQLVSEYLDDDIQHMISLESSLEQPTKPIASPDSPTLSLSSLSTISSASHPPELLSFPIIPPPSSSPPPPYTSTMEQPPIARKDISTMKEAAEKKKRKRIANILPQQQKAAAAKKRKSGRPSTQETLTRIANDEIDTDKISFYVLWMDQKRKRKQF
jgi:hypothetical protein